jgi:5-methyltetrahydropteroyltriglutamate--homocysteine methyltransferase
MGANKLLTTHVGSLPGPEGFDPASPHAEDSLYAAIQWVVEKQRAIGLDIVNEGELAKGGDWLSFLDGRLGGFEARAPRRTPVIQQGLDREQFAAFYAYAGKHKTLFYAEDNRMLPARRHWICTAPITYTGGPALERELRVFKDVLGGDTRNTFVTTTAPSSIEPYRGNDYYRSEEDFVFAIAEALATEYETIAKAGFIVQIDDAWLAALWDRIGVRMGLEHYQRYCQIRVHALNHALRNVPEEQIRYHLCWGSWHGPHAFDIPMKDMVQTMLSVKAKYYSFEAANARHEHEYEIWDSVKLPAGKLILPGVVTHSTDLVEHPELVAQRLKRFVKRVGAENVIASTDCGFGGRTHPQIAWAKLKSLVEGAALVSKAL